MFNRRFAVPLFALLAVTPFAASADPVYLVLEASRIGVIQGDSPQTSLGRENTIMCVLFRYSLRATATSTEAGTVTCRKPLDRATTPILQALLSKDVMTMDAKFFRVNPVDGTVQQHYTVRGELGRVLGVKQLTPDDSGSAAFEEVTFEFSSLTFTWTDGGATAEWTAPR